MDFSNVGGYFVEGDFGNAYQYAGRTRKTAAGSTFFTESLQRAERIKAESTQSNTYIDDISRAYSTGKPNAVNFADAFPQYDVVTHVGNTNVSAASWRRNDFPFWKYFDKNASADCLNNWKASGPNPPQTDAYIQRNLSSIGAGKMAVLIPDSLQEKMDADEGYAKKIMAKVQKWKEDYDRRDNMLAASYGYDVAAHQAGKSYCIQLDENGDVVNATICGGGRITRSSDEMVKANRERREKEAVRRKLYYEHSIEEAAKRKAYYEHSIEETAKMRAYYEHSIGETAKIRADYEHVIEEYEMKSDFLSTFGPNAPDSVVKAWRETEAELGAYGVGPDGKMSHISQMMVQRAIKWMNGDDSGDILGSTVGSALKAAMDALYSLEHPLEPNQKHSPEVEQARKKEKEFYELFIQKLEF